jgi:hypothetical protein
MKTPEGKVNLPIAAIGALELGQKPEALKIVRRELGMNPEEASELVDHYLNAHPVSRVPGFESGSVRREFWIVLVLFLVVALCGYAVVI